MKCTGCNCLVKPVTLYSLARLFIFFWLELPCTSDLACCQARNTNNGNYCRSYSCKILKKLGSRLNTSFSEQTKTTDACWHSQIQNILINIYVHVQINQSVSLHSLLWVTWGQGITSTSCSVSLSSPLLLHLAVSLFPSHSLPLSLQSSSLLFCLFASTSRAIKHIIRKLCLLD